MKCNNVGIHSFRKTTKYHEHNNKIVSIGSTALAQ